jgi:hypothetical protein
MNDDPGLARLGGASRPATSWPPPIAQTAGDCRESYWTSPATPSPPAYPPARVKQSPLGIASLVLAVIAWMLPAFPSIAGIGGGWGMFVLAFPALILGVLGCLPRVVCRNAGRGLAIGGSCLGGLIVGFYVTACAFGVLATGLLGD